MSPAGTAVAEGQAGCLPSWALYTRAVDSDSTSALDLGACSFLCGIMIGDFRDLLPGSASLESRGRSEPAWLGLGWTRRQSGSPARLSAEAHAQQRRERPRSGRGR